jgi:hypothetical protein
MMSGVTVPPVVDEATKRSGVVWVRFDDGPERIAWHLWHDDSLWLVCGGQEQELPGGQSATTAVVTVRSKASQNDRVAVWSAAVTRVVPGSAQWEAVVPLLHDKRLNPPDGEQQPARWARESAVLRLQPLP